MSESIEFSTTSVTPSDQDDLAAESVATVVHWHRKVHTRKILFVDDDERFLALCARRFEGSDYEICTASGATEALSLLQREHIDVVISDMCMPDQTGAELLNEVARKYPRVIRIVVSGKLDAANTLDAINIGQAYRYILKPFNEKDLKLTIYQALLHRERLDAELRRKQQSQDNARRRAKELGEILAHTVVDVDQAYGEIVGLLARMAEDRTGRFAKVAQLADLIALELNLSEEIRRQLRVAALLQDLGSTTRKPVAEMGPEECRRYMGHPTRAAKLLSMLTPFKAAAKIVQSHHECYNGEGFPRGLKAEAIPLGARVLTVANDYYELRAAGNAHMGTLAQLLAQNWRYDTHILEMLENFELVGFTLETESSALVAEDNT